MATGDAAITFNPSGVSFLTRLNNNLSGKLKDGQIRAFVVGEIVDKSQRFVGSKANEGDFL